MTVTSVTQGRRAVRVTTTLHLIIALRLVTVLLSIVTRTIASGLVSIVARRWLAATPAGLFLALSPLVVVNGVLITPRSRCAQPCS